MGKLKKQKNLATYLFIYLSICLFLFIDIDISHALEGGKNNAKFLREEKCQGHSIGIMLNQQRRSENDTTDTWHLSVFDQSLSSGYDPAPGKGTW